ncbi:MAG: DMT family transporter [Lentimicrobiaceae bacterium]|nr:DMT family transporter [Lentimicrobiaceae bacterium]
MEERNQNRIAYGLIIISMIFWGMSFIWTSIVFRCYPPVTTIFLRLALSSFILMAVLLATRKLERIRRKDVGLFLIASFFNPFLYFIGENFGLKYTSPSISAVVIATIPLLTPVAAWFIIRERISWLNIAGIVLSFAGILLMLINRDMTISASPAGIGFLFFAVISAVIYTPFLKKLTQRYDPVSIIAWQNLFGVLYFLPLFLIFDLNEFITIKPGWRTISALIQLSLFASTFAYILFTYGVKKIGVSRTNVFTNLIPIFTAFFSWFILSEYFNLHKILGILIVIAGVILTQFQHLKKKGQRLN